MAHFHHAKTGSGGARTGIVSGNIFRAADSVWIFVLRARFRNRLRRHVALPKNPVAPPFGIMRGKCGIHPKNSILKRWSFFCWRYPNGLRFFGGIRKCHRRSLFSSDFRFFIFWKRLSFGIFARFLLFQKF